MIRTPDCREMTADNSSISEMLIQKLFYWIFSVRSSEILHKNNPIHTFKLLKSWIEMVAQKTLIALSSDGDSNRTYSACLLEKKWPYDK